MGGILKAWDEVQLDPLSEPPDSFDGLSLEEAVKLIENWFFENFEDPVHETPYDGKEGGYIYIWGGPYDAADIIGNVFAETASQEIIDAAINAVGADGTIEWAPNSRRIQPPDDEPPNKATLDATALHGQMIERLTALEAAMATLSVGTPGLGHNHPPEPIEEEPLSANEQAEIAGVIAILKVQPPEPAQISPEIERAVRRLEALGSKVAKYFADKGNLFLTEAVKSAGSEFGK